MPSKISDSEVFLNRIAVSLTGFGLLLLLVKIASVVILRFNGGGGFGSGFLDSSADSHRFIAYVGLTLVGGLIYGLGGIGRVLSMMVSAIVLWQVISWYSNYQSYMPISNVWQVIDATVFFVIFLITTALLVYLPYQLVTSLTQGSASPGSGSPRMAK